MHACGSHNHAPCHDLRAKSAGESGSYTTREWIERITVLGMPSKPSSITASDGSALAFVYDAAKKSLVVKKPSANVLVDFDFTVAL